jgi:DNA repair protein RecN (Recombination protein N)
VGADADEDGTLIAVRTVSADGRSRAHLGGRSVPVGVLGRLAEATLACTGRTTSCGCCARPSSGRCWTGSPASAVAAPLQRYRAVRAEWQRVAGELAERRDGARRMAQEADLLRHGLTEIAAVDPQPGRTPSWWSRPSASPRSTSCGRWPCSPRRRWWARATATRTRPRRSR